MAAPALHLLRSTRSPIYGYVRKSTEDNERQVMSLDRQKEEIARFVERKGWGEVDRWFEETQSGKDFDRPAYKALLAACELNKQRNGGGRVVCLDYDRFARSVDARLKTNPLEYQRQVIRLYDAGWELDYALTPKSGNMMQDSLTSAMKSLMAGEYIEKLSMTSRSGKRKAGINGSWNGGPAPFPADRYDARTGRRLERGERASNGQSVLGPPADGGRLTHWIDGAHMLLAGHSLDAVAQMFDAHGVENYYGGTWRHAHIAKIFSNPALIGKVEYCFTRDDGTEEIFTGPARWTPIVPVDLYYSVSTELKKRETTRARPNREYCLELECYHCGAHYVAATVRRGGERRTYTHPVPTSKMNQEQAARTAAAGCKHWYLAADATEDSVRDVIVAQRGRKEFYDMFVQLLKEQESLQSKAEELEQAAEKRTKDLERKRANLIAQMEDTDDPESRAAIMDRVTERTREIQIAQAEWRLARDRREVTVDGNEEVLRLVEEAQHIKDAWDQPGEVGVAARHHILETWVDKILVEVVREPGRQRNLERRLHIFLHTTPNSPRVISLPMEGKGTSELCRRMGRVFLVLLPAGG